ncbi:MAG: DUF2752 domain-containing protein [Muribaculaceae bacterium]|nr:DUF2752 domain-containing protein [Muribaculaceae bacterium]
MSRPKAKPRARTVVVIAAAVLALAAILLFYYFADPTWRWMPRCTFRALTGYDCPGCGFQRALHAALHGHIAEAWGYNPFVFFAVPVAVFYIVVEAMRVRFPRLHARANHPFILTGILVAIIAFWIGRNM